MKEKLYSVIDMVIEDEIEEKKDEMNEFETGVSTLKPNTYHYVVNIGDKEAIYDIGSIITKKLIDYTDEDRNSEVVIAISINKKLMNLPKEN